jgi:hypothetical protein
MSDDKHTLTVTMKGDTAGYHGLKSSKQTQCGRIYEAKQENLQDIPCIYFLTDKREPRKHQSKLISEASKLKLWTSRARRDKFQLVSEAVFLQNPSSVCWSAQSMFSYLIITLAFLKIGSVCGLLTVSTRVPSICVGFFHSLNNLKKEKKTALPHFLFKIWIVKIAQLHEMRINFLAQIKSKVSYKIKSRSCFNKKTNNILLVKFNLYDYVSS